MVWFETHVSISVYIFIDIRIYIYIFIYIHICMYIYIYMYGMYSGLYLVSKLADGKVRILPLCRPHAALQAHARGAGLVSAGCQEMPVAPTFFGRPLWTPTAWCPLPF